MLSFSCEKGKFDGDVGQTFMGLHSQCRLANGKQSKQTLDSFAVHVMKLIAQELHVED